MILDDYKMLEAITKKKKSQWADIDVGDLLVMADPDPVWDAYVASLNKDELDFVIKLFDNTDTRVMLNAMQKALTNAPVDSVDPVLETFIKKYAWWAINSLQFKYTEHWKDFSKGLLRQIKSLAESAESDYKDEENW